MGASNSSLSYLNAQIYHRLRHSLSREREYFLLHFMNNPGRVRYSGSEYRKRGRLVNSADSMGGIDNGKEKLYFFEIGDVMSISHFSPVLS